MTPLSEQASVRVWMESASIEPEDERLEVLFDFCGRVGRDPDELISACLKEIGDTRFGDGQFKIRHKGRREIAAAINEFQTDIGDQRKANYVRSFLIHNGVHLQAPGILR